MESRQGRRLIPVTTVVLMLICLMYALTYVDRVNVSTAASSFSRDLHLTNTQIGLVFSAFAYPYLIFQIVGGWVSDKFGARRTLTICGLIWAVATMLTGAATSLGTMLGARVLLGFGEGATFPSATRALGDWMPARRRAFAQGITHSSARLGNAVTPPLVALLIRVSGWRKSFVIAGILSLVWVFTWLFYFRDDPRVHKGISAAELAELRASGPQAAESDPVPWGPLIRRMAPVTIVYFCYGWTLWLYSTWIPSFFQHNYHLSLGTSALFSAEVFFAGVIGDTLGGVVSDRVLVSTGNLSKSRRNLVVIGMLCSLAFMAPIAFLHSLGGAVICLSAAFFFAELTVGPMWAIPMDIAPRFCGSASGLMNVGSAVAAIISPPIGGFIVDKTGNWNLPFVGSAVLLLFGAVLAFWMKPGEELGPRTAQAVAANHAAL